MAVPVLGKAWYDRNEKPARAEGGTEAYGGRERRAMKRHFRVLAVFLAWILLAAGGASLAETAPGTARIVNHRGFNTAAPENTLQAYELSAEMGYTCVETDVCFTKDLVPVLLHDPTINRTARNADGSRIARTVNINSITYEEALAYDFGVWKGEAYAGTKIPTFEEFLSLCRDRGLHPYIELKDNGAYRREQIESLVDTVRAYGLPGGVTWISLDLEYLEWVRDRDPEARLGLLAAFWLTGGGFRNILKNTAVLRTGSNEVFLDVNHTMLALGGGIRCVEMCREAGIPLEVWTVDSPDVIRTLDPYITGVTTNSYRPDPQ